MSFFETAAWYIKVYPKPRSAKHMVIETIEEDNQLPKKRYLVRVMGSWHPAQGFTLQGASRFKMVLLTFDDTEWTKVSEQDQNEAIMALFMEK